MKDGIPSFIAPCLWSYDVNEISLEDDKELIITQVLNYGVWRDIKWLYSVYAEDDIRRVVSEPRRGLWFPRVLNFWETVLGVEISESMKERALFKLAPF